MNLNKTLCKYLDIEKKGYVCIGDVVYSIFFYGILSAALCGWMYSFYQGYLLIISGRVFSRQVFFDDVTGLNEHMGCFGIAIMIIILAVLIVAGIAYACTIKIAKCESKKDK